MSESALQSFAGALSSGSIETIDLTHALAAAQALAAVMILVVVAQRLRGGGCRPWLWGLLTGWIAALVTTGILTSAFESSHKGLIGPLRVEGGIIAGLIVAGLTARMAYRRRRVGGQGAND